MPTEPTGVAGASRRAVQVQCESCLGVVATAHPWDHVTCPCGRVGVSGRPWRPRIEWVAAPGAGWRLLADDDDRDEPGALDDAAEVAVAPRPIGY